MTPSFSGINIQNPDSARPGGSRVPGGDMVRELLRRAQEFVLLFIFISLNSLFILSHRGGQAPEDSPRPTAFFGGGHTLGSDDTPSSFIPDPNATDLGTSSAIAPSIHPLSCNNRPGSRPALDLLEERLSS
jgi:UBX domain-containing protein 1